MIDQNPIIEEWRYIILKIGYKEYIYNSICTCLLHVYINTSLAIEERSFINPVHLIGSAYGESKMD